MVQDVVKHLHPGGAAPAQALRIHGVFDEHLNSRSGKLWIKRRSWWPKIHFRSEDMRFAVVEIHDGVILQDGRCSSLRRVVCHSQSRNACLGRRRRAPPARPHDLKMKMSLLTGEWQGAGFAHEANRCIFYMVFHYFWGQFFQSFTGLP